MNKVIMIGNLTRDPDVRSTGSGVSVCSFRIAVSRRFSGQSGERVSDFFDVVAWRTLAELCGKYLAKGRRVAVVGELQTRSYDAKDGTKRYVTEIVADEVEFLSPRGQDGGGDSFGSGGGYDSAPEGRHSSPAPQLPADGFTDIEDDELPF